MKNLQVRVEEEELETLDELAQDLSQTRSEVARTALREGVKRIRVERALARYLHHEFTLSRAAEYAGLGIYEMSQLVAERGVPFFRYGPEELARDAARARGAAD